jgi:hypothetical protein
MIKYIYNTAGKVVGFALGKYIYKMNGQLIGQLNGSHVHRVSGHYVGEFYKDMIVDLHTGNVTIIRDCEEVGDTNKLPSPKDRKSTNYGFPDVFALLTQKVAAK